MHALHKLFNLVCLYYEARSNSWIERSWMASLTLAVMVVRGSTCHLVILSVCMSGSSLVNFSLFEVVGNLCQYIHEF